MRKVEKIYHLPIGLGSELAQKEGPSFVGTIPGVFSAGLSNVSANSIIFRGLESGAKSLLENSPTLTSQWMDGVGSFSNLYPKNFGGAMHRLGHGHSHSIFHDLPKVLGHPNLSTNDFFSHLGEETP